MSVETYNKYSCKKSEMVLKLYQVNFVYVFEGHHMMCLIAFLNDYIGCS